MEASVTNTGGDGQAADAGQDAGQGFDLSPLQDRISQLGEDVVQRLDQFGQRLDSFENDPGDYDEPDAFEGFDPNDLMDPSGQMDPNAARQALADAVERGVQQKLAEVVGPLAQRMEQMQTSWDAASLQQRIPDLAKPEVAEQTVARASEFAQQIAANPDEARALVRNPGFIELVYQAGQAQAQASAERPAEPGAPEFEAAGGASPGGTEPNIAEQIVKARGASSPFWGV